MRLAHQFQGRKVKTSKVKVTRPIMLTHIVHHIFRTARPTDFKLGVWMEDDDPHQPQAPWPPRSKVKVARSRDQSKPSWPNDVPVSLEAGGGIPCRPNPAATLFALLYNATMTGTKVYQCIKRAGRNVVNRHWQTTLTTPYRNITLYRFCCVFVSVCLSVCSWAPLLKQL